jgi:hypothetical protein
MIPTASTIGCCTLFVITDELALESAAPLPSVDADLINASSNMDDELDTYCLDDSP